MDASAHLCTREWRGVPSCSQLCQLVGDRCLFYRSFPSPEHLIGVLEDRLRRFFILADIPKETAEEVAGELLPGSGMPFCSSTASLWSPRFAKLCCCGLLERSGQQACSLLGLIVTQVILCREKWLKLQRRTFLESSRYVTYSQLPVRDTDNYSEETLAHLCQFLRNKTGDRVSRPPPLEVHPQQGTGQSSRSPCF